jgi:hypothetical protein
VLVLIDVSSADHDVHKLTCNLLALLNLSLTSCVVTLGDDAVKIKGQFVDQRGAPYSTCRLKAKHGNLVVEDSKVLAGKFQETIIFPATIPGRSLIVYGSCMGASSTYEHEIHETPEDFTQYLNLGDIVLEREDGT